MKTDRFKKTSFTVVLLIVVILASAVASVGFIVQLTDMSSEYNKENNQIKPTTIESTITNDSPYNSAPTFPKISKNISSEDIDTRDPGGVTVQTSKNTTVNSINIERFALYYINEYRKENGLQPWSYSTVISSVSRGHSYDMSSRDFFDHTNPSGEDPWDRFNSEDCSSSYGENIVKTYIGHPTTSPDQKKAIYYTEKQAGKAIVEYWKGSPPHNELLLKQGSRASGMGAYIAETENEGYELYATLNVCEAK